MKQMLSGLLAVLLLFFGFSEAGREENESVPPAPAPSEESALTSRYEGVESGSSIIRTKTGEAAFVNPKADNGFWRNGDFDTIKGASVPNTVTGVRDLSAAGVNTLKINAHLCGVAVEPIEGKDFELSTVGLSNGLTIAVETQTEGGVLTLTCTGRVPEAVYVNPSADFRVNTVRLGVPKGILQSIGTDCGAASILISSLDVPVQGVGTNGVTCVAGETGSTPVELRSGNGCVAVRVENMSGAVTLSAENGSVFLGGCVVTGRAELSAQNGSVHVEVSRLDSARLEAVNGKVEAEVGIVGKDVFAGVRNGELDFALTQTPKDLTFRLSGGWERNVIGRWNHGEWAPGSEPEGLPNGWYDGYAVGSGNPVLELSAASNGTLNLKVGEKSS